MVRHLLVPIDGSELSIAAVNTVVAFAKQCGARLTFFNAQPSYYGRPDVAIYGEGLVLDPALNQQFAEANAPLFPTPRYAHGYHAATLWSIPAPLEPACPTVLQR